MQSLPRRSWRFATSDDPLHTQFLGTGMARRRTAPSESRSLANPPPRAARILRLTMPGYPIFACLATPRLPREDRTFPRLSIPEAIVVASSRMLLALDARLACVG